MCGTSALYRKSGEEQLHKYGGVSDERTRSVLGLVSRSGSHLDQRVHPRLSTDDHRWCCGHLLLHTVKTSHRLMVFISIISGFFLFLFGVIPQQSYPWKSHVDWINECAQLKLLPAYCGHHLDVVGVEGVLQNTNTVHFWTSYSKHPNFQEGNLRNA